jgi:hypothetical protein
MVYRDGAAGTITFQPFNMVAYGAVGPWVSLIIEPLPNARIPSRNPTIRVEVSAMIPPASVSFEVATDVGFTNIVWSVTDTLVPNGPWLHVCATTLTDLTTYWVRSRAGNGSGTWGPYSTIKFTVDLNAGRGYAEVYLNVGIDPLLLEDYGSRDVFVNQSVIGDSKVPDVEYVYANVGLPDLRTPNEVQYMYEGDVSTNTPTPGIWFLAPDSGREGDGVRIFGFGTGALAATYSGVVQAYFGPSTGWQNVPVVTWTVYPETANAYTAARTIDTVSGVIDPQHAVIEIVVPPGALPPGFSLRIRTNGP